MLTPDEIAARQFLVSLRGYDREEVAAFLREVADEVATLRGRVRELERDLEAAQASGGAASAVPVARAEATPAASIDTREALKLLGEETTRILVAAEDSAAVIRQRAEERVAAELETARRESRDEIEGARRTASKIVADAERRRAVIAEDIRGLEATRDRFLGELRVAMKGVQESVRSMQSASGTTQIAGGGADALPAGGVASARESGPSGASTAGADDDEVATGQASEPDADALDGDTAAHEGDVASAPVGVAGTMADDDTPLRLDEVEGEPVDGDTDEELLAAAAAVEVLDADADAPDGDAAEDDAPDGAASDDGVEVDDVHSLADETTADEDGDVEAATEGDPFDADLSDVESDDRDPIGMRAQSLGGVRPGMLRRLKRGMQDVQNAVLDAVQKGGEVDGMLPSEEDLAELASTAQLFLSAAYRAGLSDGAALSGDALGEDETGDPSRVPASAATFQSVLAHEIRSTLQPSLRAGTEAGEPATSLSERVGEVFRDLKGPIVESLVDEHLAKVYASGTLDLWRARGVERIRWVLGDESRCPENRCRTNVTEGAAAPGDEFASGDRQPPAHDGCACALLPALPSAGT
ncbi:MAG: DivIVA domain-containing protein [Actinomycetes bacterium]